MVRAVSEVHAARIVHGDLKPANFVICKEKIKLIDFGIAKSMSDNTTHIIRDKAVGSIHFMAPETVRPAPTEKNAEQQLSRAADIWALGAILYRLLYRRHIFQKSAKDWKSSHEIVVFLHNPSSEIDFPEFDEKNQSSETIDSLKSILRGCLEWDPGKRIRMSDLMVQPFVRGPLLRLKSPISSYELRQKVLMGVLDAFRKKTIH